MSRSLSKRMQTFFVSKTPENYCNIDTRNGGLLSNRAILAIYINFRKVFRKMPSKFNRLFVESGTGSLKLSIHDVRLGKSSKNLSPDLKQKQFGTLSQLNHLIPPRKFNIVPEK